ncbi:hypothetical protein H6P81_018953 [Aristolochia fimbriata]|uniref:glutathione transferase n=1 Tax=Aristolochia fimbriata TaxID=158543 RepID=A0AAV7E3M3_ARIFI|nr:hypothetical protein H6P81_018953 [Aristolochia fimbriata]
MGEVKLIGAFARPFYFRVKWALKYKGIEFEIFEEDLMNKSPILLQYNPVHKKVPVLVHRGKPIAESRIILDYIEETWQDPPLLPEDPLERATTKFWAHFIDVEFWASMTGIFLNEGEEQEKYIKPALQGLATIDQALEGKKFFGGEKIGYTDLVLGWIPYWLPVVEEVSGVKLFHLHRFPSLSAWAQNFMDLPLIYQNLPPRDEFLRILHETRAYLTEKYRY